MFKIHKSFADCKLCKLYDEYSCIMETNCEDDLSNVKLLFVAENPGKDEINAERPLVGKAGKIFRHYFEKYNLNKVPYLLTNTVLCQTVVNGKTTNPDNETIERCKINCFKLIKECDPELIVLLGTTPMKAFGIADSGITKRRGQFYKWEDYDVFVTVHPSFVSRRGGRDPQYDQEFLLLSKRFNDDESTNVEDFLQEDTTSFEVNNSQIHYYKIPDKFYTDKYRLVDIHYLNFGKKIIYIFRDENNQKVYYEYKDVDYYYYKPQQGKKIEKIMLYSHMKKFKTTYDKVRSELSNDSSLYEADLSLDVKHTIDYFIQNNGEREIDDYNVMYFDIEIGTTSEFPDPNVAKYPVVLITTLYHNKLKTYFLWEKKEDWAHFKNLALNSKTELKLYDSEINLLRDFIADFRDVDPDFLSGWNNINFDIQYLYNRLLYFKIDPAHSWSKYNDMYVNSKYSTCSMPGNVVVDQYILYRNFTFGNRENYKLGYIAQLELGETKEKLPCSISQMYKKYPELYIQYNIKDVVLLEKLEEKLGHIMLLVEIQKICHTTVKAALSTFGQVDSCIVSFLKKNKLTFQNANRHTQKVQFPGAFVKNCIPGIYEWVTDFDFSSLYPSLIMTYNIGPNTFVLKFKNNKDIYDYLYRNNEKDIQKKTFKMIKNPVNNPTEITMTFSELKKLQNDRKLICTINGCFFKNHDEEESIYLKILEPLLSTRKVYKKKMLDAIEKKDEKKVNFYKTKQLAYKVLANSHYGVIGNKVFRFFNVDNASAITLSGQEALKTSIIYANSFLDALNKGTDFKEPQMLSFDELFNEKMERETPYVIAGDTDSIFCCFQKFNKVDQIQEYCNKVQTFLNDDILIKLIKRHNVDPKYTKLNLKNELVCKRGLFLAKKRYAIWVIGQEGKKVDKIISMGLETKRSDYPSATKEFLNDLLDIILKSEKISIAKLYQHISKEEKRFISLIRNGDKSIAKPISYTRQKESYAVIPQGVRAMENWNEIVSDDHRPGSKAYLFHIKGFSSENAPKEIQERYNNFITNHEKKLSVIGVPDEENGLPKYFIPDIRAMLKFVFIDRYKLLLDPIFKVQEQQKIMTF